ncbi:MAG: FMN-binding glutamate synthase family protein, partial [Pseudomonadota bacterium]
MDFIATGLQFLAALFVVAIGIGVLAVAAMFVIDRFQVADAVRRNYPVLGRFRHLFTELGEFFRQYFFAMDREELPFNRAQRDFIARAASGKGNTIAFGSTRNLTVPGTAIFANTAFPVLDEDVAPTARKVIGPHARQPYAAPSFFNISGMSFGALSKPAVKALSRGAAEAGIWYNTGEGGLSDWHLEGGCDIVFQIGTAKYGVRDAQGRLSDAKLREVAAHSQVKMFEIKLSQGAKPGKGGILPAEKVTSTIARIRGIPEGQASISPNRHPEIASVNDLLDMIAHIREVTGKPVGFKSVIGSFDWIEELCEKVLARGEEHAPDFFTIDSGDGGTGAAPMPLMDNVGLTVRESLPLVSDILHRHGLRERIRLIASGKLVNPTDVAWALATGADFVVSARGFMFSLGCIQALKCNKNTCPT